MLKLFCGNDTLPIILPADASEAVRLAAEDLQRDLRYLSGQKNGFEILSVPYGGPSITVKTDGEGVSESYTVSVTDRGVTVSGADVLGTVYGIYAFSERVLGFSPTHLWTELMPEVRETMCVQETEIKSPERKVRFRGLFVND